MFYINKRLHRCYVSEHINENSSCVSPGPIPVVKMRSRIQPVSKCFVYQVGDQFIAFLQSITKQWNDIKISTLNDDYYMEQKPRGYDVFLQTYPLFSRKLKNI